MSKIDAIASVPDVIQYIQERLAYLDEKKRKISKEWKVGETIKNPEYHLRVGMTNELVIIREMLKQLYPANGPAPLDFIGKAFEMLRRENFGQVQATYKEDGITVVVRKATREELEL